MGGWGWSLLSGCDGVVLISRCWARPWEAPGCPGAELVESLAVGQGLEAVCLIVTGAWELQHLCGVAPRLHALV